jgi:hypothetical protein
VTKVEAKKLVKRMAINLIRSEVTIGSDWIIYRDDGELRNDSDFQRIKEAIEEFASRLENEGQIR